MKALAKVFEVSQSKTKKYKIRHSLVA